MIDQVVAGEQFITPIAINVAYRRNVGRTLAVFDPLAPVGPEHVEAFVHRNVGIAEFNDHIPWFRRAAKISDE